MEPESENLEALASSWYVTSYSGRGAVYADPLASSSEAIAVSRGSSSVVGVPGFALQRGRRAADLVNAMGPRLVSARFQEALTSAEASGWDTYPIEVHDDPFGVLDGYRGLIVRGRAGDPDYSRSERFVAPPPVPGGQATPTLRGITFAGDRWDGSDVFHAGKTGFVFVTDRVAQVLRAANLYRVELQPRSQVETPEYEVG